MDYVRSYPFPGLVFLFVQIIYRFVPYGDYLLSFALIAFLLFGTAHLLFQLSHRLSRSRA